MYSPLRLTAFFSLFIYREMFQAQLSSVQFSRSVVSDSLQPHAQSHHK